MRYFFVFLSIAAIWGALLMIAAFIPTARGIGLYVTGQVLTIFLFLIGFYKK